MARGKAIQALALFAAVLGSFGAAVFGQQPGGSDQSPGTAREMAPTDLSGYWEAIVVEDWRYRMLPPIKFQERPRLGERNGIPMNAEAREIALAWDANRDEAAGERCKAYGAPNIMRLPGRIRISWRDDQTLMLETEAGTQTRVFEFGSPTARGGGWQGVSRAAWDRIPGGASNDPGPRLTGSLKVVTDSLRPGYLQKNGVPYSQDATVTEYFARVDENNGDSYLIITTTVQDPAYLTESYLTTTHFKKLPDDSDWSPTSCTVR